MTRSAQMPLLFRNASKELRVVLLAPRRHPNKTPSHIYKQLTALEIYQCWWYPRGQGLVRHFAFSFRSFWSLNPVLFQSTIVWERNFTFWTRCHSFIRGKEKKEQAPTLIRSLTLKLIHRFAFTYRVHFSSITIPLQKDLCVCPGHWELLEHCN